MQYHPTAVGWRVVLHPNFEGRGPYSPIRPSQSQRIHIVILRRFGNISLQFYTFLFSLFYEKYFSDGFADVLSNTSAKPYENIFSYSFADVLEEGNLNTSAKPHEIFFMSPIDSTHQGKPICTLEYMVWPIRTNSNLPFCIQFCRRIGRGKSQYVCKVV